jgi:colicin import membrane protein
MPRRDSSVLFSLNELRTIEEERCLEEAEAERMSREAAARELKAAEEARRRLIEEAEREAAREREHERREAEERLRLREAELRVEAERQALVERMRLDADAKAVLSLRRSFPVGRVIAGGLLSVGLVIVVMILIMQKRDAEVVQRARDASDRFDLASRDLQRQQAAEKARLEAQLAELKARLERANDTVLRREPARPAPVVQDRRRGGHARLVAPRPEPAPEEPAPPSPLQLAPKDFEDPISKLKVD